MSLGCVVAWLCLYRPVLWGETIAMDSERGGAPSLDRPVFFFECGCAWLFVWVCSFSFPLCYCMFLLPIW